MKPSHNKSFTLVFIVLLPLMVVWAGCKTAKPVYTPENITVPDSYAGKADSSGMPPLRNIFFTDSNLAYLINEALAGNFDIKIAQQRVEMARNNVLLSRSALAPTVGINTFGSNTRYGRHTMDGAGNATTPEVPSPIVPSYMLGVSSSWEIDLWGKLRNRKRASQMRYLGTDMGKNLVITALVSELSYRYYDLLAQDEQLRIIYRNIELQESALRTVQTQKEGGRATELAVKQFSAQLLQTRALEYKVKQEVVRLENEICMLTGKYWTRVPRMGSIFTTHLPAMVGTGVPSRLLQNRADIMQAEQELRASKADVAVARAAFLPSLSISAYAGYNTYHPELLFNPVSLAFNLLGSLTGPLINQRAVKAGYGQSLAQNKEAYYQYGKIVMDAVLEVNTTLSSIDNINGQFALNEKEARELTSAIAIAKDLYLAGYANYLEIITAQKNAIDAELRVVDARKQLYISNINLYRALGGGWK